VLLLKLLLYTITLSWIACKCYGKLENRSNYKHIYILKVVCALFCLCNRVRGPFASRGVRGARGRVQASRYLVLFVIIVDFLSNCYHSLQSTSSLCFIFTLVIFLGAGCTHPHPSNKVQWWQWRLHESRTSYSQYVPGQAACNSTNWLFNSHYHDVVYVLGFWCGFPKAHLQNIVISCWPRL